MKRNLIYFLVLLSLITIAYYTEEVYKKEASVRSEIKTKLLNPTQRLSGVKAPNFFLKVHNGSFWQLDNKSLETDQDSVAKLHKILSAISVSSFTKEKRMDLFSEETSIPFSVFLNGKEKKYILGDVSKATGSFYIIEKMSDWYKVYICFEESLYEHVYHNQLDLDLKRYLRLKNYLSASSFAYQSKGLAQFILPIEPVVKVKIDNRRNKAFSVDLHSNETTPNAFLGLKYVKLDKNLGDLISNVRITKVFKGGQYVLSNPSSKVTISSSEENLHMKLYNALNGEYGHYLKLESRDDIFQVEIEPQNIFYANVQDFWLKKIPLSKELLQKKSYEFELSKNDRVYYKFEIPDLNQFKVIGRNKLIEEVGQVYFNVLFNLIFCLADFSQAEYVLGSASEAKENALYIKFYDLDLRVQQDGKHFMVLDRKSDLEYYFKYNTKLIEADFFNNIFTVKAN